MKYTFIAAHTEQFPVQRMCRVLEVGRSGYYAWQRRSPSSRAQANQILVELIRAEHQASRKTYGSPRIQMALQHKGVACGRHRVARLMHQHGIHVQRTSSDHSTPAWRGACPQPAQPRLFCPATQSQMG